MKQIHLIMPFTRVENKEKLINAYRPMNILLHTIMFRDEVTDFSEPWILPFVIDEFAKNCTVPMPGTYKRNRWIEANKIVDDDYYVTADDDDMYEGGVFDAIKEMDDDIVIISMKRGIKTPDCVETIRAYPISTLLAKPEYVKIGGISAQQSFVKGKIFKNHLHNVKSHYWDGELAIHHKISGEQITYREKLFALFNYYEPGRWSNDIKISFGVMTNLPSRLDMALKQSQLPGDMHYIRDPESATKGLNKLLDVMEKNGADVAILVHHDMSFRNPWLGKIREELAKLPESWVVAGIIGKDMQGRVCGVFHDTRIPMLFNTANIHTFPQPACCFDECCIMVNLHKGFRFDETLDGFDLYGTLCVLQAWEMGGTAWIIDSGAFGIIIETNYGSMRADIAFAQHHCTRSFEWFPGEDFQRNFKWLYDRFSKMSDRIDTTVLADQGQLRFETSAAA